MADQTHQKAGDQSPQFGKVKGNVTITQYIDRPITSPVPFQAPPWPQDFVPRPEVTDTIKARLLNNEPTTQGILVTSAIYGLGGIGKSTIAITLAHDPDVRRHFSDGILWTTLGEHPDILSCLKGWIQTMGDYKFQPTTAKVASTRLRTLLQNKAMLLVLDDIWETEDVSFLKVGGSRCQVLITTREKILAHIMDADVYELDVMTRNQAVMLLARKIKRELQEDDLENAEILAKEVGYLPLALELAGTLIGSGTPWKELIEDLQAEIAHLEALEYPEADEIKDEAILKRICLRASFALSLRRLSEGNYTRFIWLGVLHEDVNIIPSTAAKLWGIATSQARKTLQYLSDRALLFPGSPLPDHTLTYRMHDLLRDFACNLIQASSTPTSSRELVGLGLTLAEAHACLLECYKQYTKDGLWHTLPPDEYIHTYLTWHMQKAEKEELIHALLKEGTEEGQNGWYQACERLGETTRFLADVNFALSLAGRDRKIGLQARYALIIASFMSLVKSLPPLVVFELIKHDIWSPTQGLAYARQIPGLSQRIDAMITLLPLIKQPLRNKMLQEILTMTQTLEKREKQMQMFVKLAPYLSERLLSDALNITQTIQDENKQAEIFVQLAPHLSTLLHRHVLTTVQSFHNEKVRATAITGLALHLPPELLKEAVRIFRTIKDTMIQMEALAGIFKYLPLELQTQILDEILKIREVIIRAKTLRMFLPYLPKKNLRQTLEIVREIEYERIRVEVLIELISFLPERFKKVGLEEALAIVETLEFSIPKSEALIKLAPYLSEELLDKAQQIAETIRDNDEICINTNKILQQQLVREVSQSIHSKKSVERLTKLKKSLEKLVPEYRTVIYYPLPEVLLQKIFHLLEKVRDKEFQMEIFINLFPYLSDKMVKKIMRSGQMDRITQNARLRTKLFANLAPYWAKSRLPASNSEIILNFVQAMGDADMRVIMLTEIIPYLPEHRRHKFLQDVLATIRSMKDKGGQVEALMKLIPYYFEILLPEVLDIIELLEDELHRAKVLTGLAPHLSIPLLKKVLASAQAIGDEREYIKLLLSLRLYLPKGLRKTLGDKLRSADIKVLEKEESIFSVRKKPSLIPHKGVITMMSKFLRSILPQFMLREMITSTQNMYEPQELLKALRRYAPYLSKRSLQEILLMVQDISNESLLKEALAILFPYLSWLLLKEAFMTVQKIRSVNIRAEALVALAPYLSEELELLEEALKVAQSINSERFQAKALVAIIQYLPDEILLDTLPMIQAIEDKDVRIETFMEIASRLSKLPRDALWPLWEKLLKKSLYHPRPELLEELRVLLPVIRILGKQEAMIDLLHAIEDVKRWWP